MSLFTELVTSQQQIGQRIETIIRNYKKDSASRKTSTSYFQERIRRLDEEWTSFEVNDNKIREMEMIQLDHDYFQKDYYTSILNIVQQYRKEFESSMLKLPSPEATNPDRRPTTDGQVQVELAKTATAPVGELVKLMRRQAAMMASVTRLLTDNVSHNDIIAATKLWQDIEELHYKIAELCDEESQNVYNMERFIQLEGQVRAASRNLSNNTVQINHGQNIEQSDASAVPIPKITIPKFDGNYMKWKEFHDLFSSLIIKQSIPDIQKMWYLKTHVVGEASNLIKHFSSTGENFEAAWSILTTRYDNKRLLVRKVIHELTDTPTKTTNDNYKSFHDKIQECLLSLKNLGIDTSSWDPLLLHVLLKRLDQTTRLQYEQSLAQPREVPTIKEFLQFLERHFQSMESMAERERSAQSKSRVCTSITSDRNVSSNCRMCKNGNHPLFACKIFLQQTPSLRLQFVQKQNYCVNCLKPGHNAKACNSRSCMKCNKKHNTLLHLEGTNNNQAATAAKFPQNQNPENQQSSASDISTTPSNPNIASLAASNHSQKSSYVLLGTAMIKVQSNGREIQCRAILDSGSQLNLISERIVKRLGISPKPASIRLSGIGSTNTKVQHRVNVAIQSRINNFNTRLEAAVLTHIVTPQPSQSLDIDHWPIPNNIVLADPEFNRPDKIDILLGAEFYHQLMSVGQIKLGYDLPILQNTLLGWVIAGKIGGNKPLTAVCGMCTEDDTSLEEAIAQLWNMENLSQVENILSTADKYCEDHFAQTNTIDKNGRFMVKIPFCDNPDTLGESHNIAFNRFLSLERRLSKAPEVKAQYIQFMKEYEALGHMSQIDMNSIASPNYIIPHHCILRPESATTKLRVVFDASTKTSTGISLNDIMHTGPTVQSELFSILLRFRLPRFVFTTDIEKMYRQFIMHPDDRKFQIIIWRENPTMPIKYYHLNTITYGTRSAPYLATKCLQTIGKANTARYPYGAQFLLQNFYVDDGIGGADDLHTALTIQTELKHILSQHGLKLQKWTANHQKLLQNTAKDQQEVNFDFNNENHTVKTLGLTWMPTADKFCVKVCQREMKHLTKRTVSSDLARLFDPLGLLSPIVVTAKLFIQELWQLKLGWDDELPNELRARWMTFRDELKHIDNLKLPRHMFEGQISSNIQIHAFADASEKAYGAAVYIRSVIKNNQVIVRLLCAKSRVAPLKHQTLPRLELCAALLATQLTARVKRDLNFDDIPTYLWTDSEIVLAWVRSQSSLYQTFVANRIAAIQELSIAEQWRHVSSKNNPADILSRGISPRKLASNDLWFYGPIFLHGQQEMWPKEVSKANIINQNFDIERKKVAAATTASNPTDSVIYNIKHNGSFRTLQRVVGYIVRFINNSRKVNQQTKLLLSVSELEKALTLIVRAMQHSDFDEELQHLIRYKQVSKNSPYTNLAPFLDSNGIIRVGGRLEASELQYDAKHPMLIPYNDPISKLLMQMVHEENRHCGPQALLSHTRQKYWPIKGKSMARSIVQHCIKCARAKPKLLTQIMGNLPSTRISPARPFINSGVDFCGPFWVHYKIRGKRPQKAYIAVFCCFATKAVHLEVVSSLTTDAFIGALKRFISRRGHCQNLYCDNATNFVGAKNQLAELSEAVYGDSATEKIDKECTARGIMFHFIPPRAPHFGGLWEAAVKSAKHLLVRSVSTASLTYEELDTVVIEIEGILNSRPISPMSDNPNDLAALTPGHFLIGAPLNSQIDMAATETRKNLLTRWKLVTHIKQEFWRRWSQEYLSELQYRHKWQSQKKNLQPGDMVIIKEDNIMPLQWPLGRIIKVHQGDDGVVRVADVKTLKGIVRRAITRLAPLPINDTASGEDSIQEEAAEQNTSPNQANHNASTKTEKRPTSSCCQNNDKETSKKRRCATINHSIFTIIIAAMFIPLVLGAQVHNKKFGRQLGIHFEGIGSAVLSPTEWQLLVHYDLKGFWSELTLFSEGTKTLNHLCNEIQEKSSCTNLVKYFEHTEAELTMDSTLLSGKRQKRSAIDLVGNIAHSLFGVLDSEYAKDMAQTISQVKENEAHLLNLLKNQTSIIDSTINIMKSDQEAIKKKFDQIDFQITEVHNMIITAKEEHHQDRLYRLFSSLCIQLTITAANLQHTQLSLIDILTSTHHGIISPLLLTPRQLQVEVAKIKLHLPESLDLPVSQEDTLHLYKLMKVKGGLTENTVIFSVTLPLIERNMFDVFHLIPIPNWINNTLVSINPCASFLIINIARNHYFALGRTELDSCTLLKEELYLCSKSSVRHEQGSTACSCEINLFHNRTQLDCPIQVMKDSASWTPLYHKNKWIYAIPSRAQATAVCKSEITQLTLEESGLLVLEPNCILKYNCMTLQGQQTISSSSKTSYTSLWDITERTHEKRVKPLLNEIHTNEYIAQVKNLTTLQATLHEQQILQLPNKINTHNYHHITVGYTSLLITIAILIYLIIKRRSKETETPIPAPRKQPPTSAFTVHV